ncbi:MAG TPA: hypothetical protein VMK65_02300, partial [Longimicrobiales bacterium]|nr:hypothetical protein [Longimicrobiales bacterium]
RRLAAWSRWAWAASVVVAVGLGWWARGEVADGGLPADALLERAGPASPPDAFEAATSSADTSGAPGMARPSPAADPVTDAAEATLPADAGVDADAALVAPGAGGAASEEAPARPATPLLPRDEPSEPAARARSASERAAEQARQEMIVVVPERSAPPPPPTAGVQPLLGTPASESGAAKAVGDVRQSLVGAPARLQAEVQLSPLEVTAAPAAPALPALAGTCWALALGPWTPPLGPEDVRTPPERFRLDAAAAPRSSVLRRVLPMPAPLDALGGWRELPGDSLEVRWSAGHEGVRLRLGWSADGALEGTALAYSDERGFEEARAPARATPLGCAEVR